METKVRRIGTLNKTHCEMMRKWAESMAQVMRDVRDTEIVKVYKTMSGVDVWDTPITDMLEGVNQRNNATNYNMALNAKLKNRRNNE